MITPEQHAEIRRLYYGEHWKVGTIAAALGVHHDTVRAAIADTQAVRRGTCRPTALDPYLPFVRDTLAQYPRLRVTRLYEMVRPRGYAGSVVQLRRVVRLLRPQAAPTLYRRLTTLMGEEAQVDWGAFGTIRIGHGTRPLSGFVMVLSYSRALSALFTVDQTLESFLRGHVDALHGVFAGVARTLVYDNLKSAVLERQGSAIRFHPRLLELAGHYHFAPRPCTPGRGNEKGKIERQIQYLRHAFFAARTFTDVDDLNAQFRRWRDTIAHQRPHPEQRDQTVAQVFAQEQARLLPLPAHRFDTDVLRAVASGKTPYVRFDRNAYSIPHTHVRRPVTLLASATTVRIVVGTETIARHVRSYDTGQTIEDLAHLDGLLAATRQAHAQTARDRLRLAVPLTATLFDRLAARGEALRGHTARLLALLDDYGAPELTAAVTVALARDALGAGAIAHLLETRRRHRGHQPPVPLALPDHPGVRDLDVTPHRLETYDAFSRPDSDDDPDR